jgi:hypothetical protein
MVIVLKKPYGDRPGEQEIIERIRTLHREGLKLGGIEEVLNSEGIEPRNGKWHPMSVSRVLQRVEAP